MTASEASQALTMMADILEHAAAAALGLAGDLREQAELDARPVAAGPVLPRMSVPLEAHPGWSLYRGDKDSKPQAGVQRPEGENKHAN